jgi:hypothetical protein
VFVWLISHQPTVLFSQNKPATSNQPAVLFSQNKSAPTTSQTNRLFLILKLFAASLYALYLRSEGTAFNVYTSLVCDKLLNLRRSESALSSCCKGLSMSQSDRGPAYTPPQVRGQGQMMPTNKTQRNSCASAGTRAAATPELELATWRETEAPFL